MAKRDYIEAVRSRGIQCVVYNVEPLGTDQARSKFQFEAERLLDNDPVSERSARFYSALGLDPGLAEEFITAVKQLDEWRQNPPPEPPKRTPAPNKRRLN